VVSVQKLHRCILHARCPKFFDFNLSGYSTPVLIVTIHFIYSNSAESFSKLTLEQIPEALKLSQVLEMEGALLACRRLFLSLLDTDSAFHMPLKISELGLHEEIEGVLGFIGKNILTPLELLGRLGSEIPVLFLRSIDERVHPSIPPPQIPKLVLPIGHDLETLFKSGECFHFGYKAG
jgi:hypothetical protein